MILALCMSQIMEQSQPSQFYIYVEKSRLVRPCNGQTAPRARTMMRRTIELQHEEFFYRTSCFNPKISTMHT